MGAIETPARLLVGDAKPSKPQVDATLAAATELFRGGKMDGAAYNALLLLLARDYGVIGSRRDALSLLATLSPEWVANTLPAAAVESEELLTAAGQVSEWLVRGGYVDPTAAEEPMMLWVGKAAAA